MPGWEALEESFPIFSQCRPHLDIECMDQDSMATELDECSGSQRVPV